MRKPPVSMVSVLLGWLASLVVACEDDVIQVIPEPETRVDELKQKPAAEVDILWVVDNSESMVQEQQKLADNFQKFISGLTVCSGGLGAEDLCDFTSKTCLLSKAPCNPPDYHIGVISTDTRPTATNDQGRLRRVGLCVPNRGGAPANAKYRYCQVDTHCTNTSSSAEDPYDPQNATCDASQAVSFVTPTTKGARSAFARAVRVGTGGAAAERGIEAAARAVGRHTDRATGQFIPAPVENAGFLRNSASLFIIFVTDEDDDPARGGTFGQTTYFYRAFEGLKGAGNEALVSLSAIVGDPDLDGTGPLEGGCPAGAEIPTAAPGESYIRLAMYSRGLGSEFRVCDDQRLVCPSGMSCQRPLGSGYPGTCVPSGSCQRSQDCGNFLCGDRKLPCVECESARCVTKPERFVQMLSHNGIFGSICENRYDAVLSSLGFEAAGLKRKFELSRYPDCSKPISCADGSSAPMCVVVAGKVIGNDRASGWVYEPGSNAVFFDGSFVPPTEATVEVTYKVSSSDKSAIGCDLAVK